MAPNIVKELQAKVELLEKSNNTLTERLLQTEHKVGILFQWAMSFPELAASEGLAKFNVHTSHDRETNHVNHEKSRPKSQRIGKKVKVDQPQAPQPQPQPPPQQKQSPGRRRSGKYVDYSTFLENNDAELIDLSSDVESKKRKISIPRRYSDSSGKTVSGRGKMITRSIPKTVSATEDNFVDVEDGVEGEKFEDLEHVVLPIVHISESEPGNFTNDEFSKDENDLQELPDTEESDDGKSTDPKSPSKVVSINGKFHCEFCGNSYAYAHGLNRHVNAVHTRAVEFKCKVCSKAFLRRDRCKSHEASCEGIA